jgi:hypothetical protein
MSDKMDEKGFIFTTDAVLALVVAIVLTASIVTYGLLPIYQGQNHQHLEAMADSALETMEQDGTLRTAAVQYANGNTSGAQSTLTDELNVLIPNSVGYKLTMTPYGSVTNPNGVVTANDVVTKVKVVSGPQEGWMGRAYYKQDEVQFQDITGTQITTVWSFHNYLKNFSPWSSGLNTYKYWGGSNGNPQTSVPINFAIPGPVNNVRFLLGSAAGSGQTKSFGADVVFNGANHNYVLNSSFLPLYTSSGQGLIFNYLQSINTATVNQGQNNFYVLFNATSNMNMPWFNVIANYTNTLSVPKGIANDTIGFPDIAGIGRPDASTGYNLDTGAITTLPGRTENWNTIQSGSGADNLDTSTPFALTNIPNVGTGSAVATQQTIYIPPGNRLFDAYTVVNAFGGEDGAIVMIKNSTGVWNVVFSSFGSTARTDGGYGNVPGIINILPYLSSGNNTVRIITWDDVPSTDYDLVGLENCYSTVTYSKFPIRWDTFSFNSYQNTSSNKVTTETQAQNFRIDTEAQSALLFVGVGGDTRTITVTAKNSTGGTATLYTGTVPYVLNLANLDSTRVLSTVLSNGTVIPRPGNYTLTVSVTPSFAYESGDGASSPLAYGYGADPEIFSGTRISVIYPKFLQNVWATGFASTPQQASLNAVTNLENSLNAAGYSYDPSLIKNNSLYTGDVPNAIPVRLDLWEQ